MRAIGLAAAAIVFSTPVAAATPAEHAQQAVMAAGLRRQLARSDLPAPTRAHLADAQARLWRVICAADAVRTSELWSWSYVDGHYRIEPFGAEGAHEDESNAAQLWSTVFLALPPPEVATGTAGERSCR